MYLSGNPHFCLLTSCSFQRLQTNNQDPQLGFQREGIQRVNKLGSCSNFPSLSTISVFHILEQIIVCVKTACSGKTLLQLYSWMRREYRSDLTQMSLSGFPYYSDGRTVAIRKIKEKTVILSKVISKEVKQVR
uniref:Uncharacterized protein n=1 Tax=Rousettus aegyptiacus TaxID=9407 RepID=A0A7J8IMI3_ROUAE|nr:hypothetical protein HJG63_010592 [Rousettus aegyptiacus]